MKVIDLLNKIANGEEAPLKIKWNGVVFQYKENNYKAGGIYLIEWVNKTLSNLNDEIEIIEEPKEEPKEELEEIELIDNRKAYQVTDLTNGNTIDYKWEYNDIIQNTKINELIENQNKIIREMKANKKQ